MTPATDSSIADGKSPPQTTRDAILAAAVEIFSRDGYEGGSVREIAERVGTSKATIYYHYQDKQHILADIHNEFMDVLIARHEDGIVEGEDPEHTLRRILRDILSLMVTHHSHVQIFFEHHRSLEAPYREGVLRRRRAYFDGVVQAAQAGIDAGQFVNVDARLIALALFGMANWAYQWFNPAAEWDSNFVGETFGDLLLDGIRTRSR